MSILFQKVSFVVILLLFLKVSKLLIRNNFWNVRYRQGADHKKAFAVETTHCVSVCNMFVITSPFSGSGTIEEYHLIGC